MISRHTYIKHQHRHQLIIYVQNIKTNQQCTNKVNLFLKTIRKNKEGRRRSIIAQLKYFLLNLKIMEYFSSLAISGYMPPIFTDEMGTKNFRHYLSFCSLPYKLG